MAKQSITLMAAIAALSVGGVLWPDTALAAQPGHSGRAASTVHAANTRLDSVPSATPDTRPSREAKAKFIKKCFRDRTKAACEAPPDARVPGLESER